MDWPPFNEGNQQNLLKKTWPGGGMKPLFKLKDCHNQPSIQISNKLSKCHTQAVSAEAEDTV